MNMTTRRDAGLGVANGQEDITEYLIQQTLRVIQRRSTMCALKLSSRAGHGRPCQEE